MSLSTPFGSPLITNVLSFCLGALIAAALIYLTPLKWVTFIDPTYHDIDPTAFYTDFKLHPDNYLFVDVRPPAEYQMAHAVGSVNIPLVDLYDIHTSLPKHGKEIVLICTTGRSSGVAYMYLQHYGFFNIERVSGGLVNWVYEGLPVEGTAVNQWNASDHSKQSFGPSSSTLANIVEAHTCPSLLG